MFKTFINDVSIKWQITLIMGILVSMLLLFGGIGILQLSKAERLEHSEVLAENLEVHFKTQVQEWKNILIRGGNSSDFEKYLAAFKRQSVLVDEVAHTLSLSLQSHNISVVELNQFISQHRQITNNYLGALEFYQGQDIANIRQVDQQVRGIDREQVNLILLISKMLEREVQERLVASYRFISGGLIISFLLAVWMVLSYARSIGDRFNELKTLAIQLTQGELDARLTFRGKNELGALSTAFNMMAERLATIVTGVQQSGVQLSSAAVNISASTREQTVSAKEQEATTHEIMATSRQIAQTSQTLVGNMDEVAAAVDDAAALAEQGHEGLARLGDTVGKMVAASSSISNKLAVLNDKAGNINAVVTTINKVADQTNLLSVNAAIEADKAGEHGIGFGTVAKEIRRLADQTAVATFDIEDMVKEMQSAVSAGVMGMEKFSDDVRHGVEDTRRVSEQLTRIVERVQDLAPHFESVHNGMRSQTQGAEQIQEALTQLSMTVRTMNESMRQSSAVVEELNQQSDHLQSSVSAFQLSNIASV